MRLSTCGAVILTVLLHVLPGTAAAQDVLLTARLGGLEIEGTLLGYDRDSYRVETIYGPLTIDAGSVICSGPGCPDLGAYVPELTVIGNADAANRLLVPLLETYAARIGVTPLRRVRSDTEFSLELVPRGDGPALARFDFLMDMERPAREALTTGYADIAILLGSLTDDAQLRTRLLALDAAVPTDGATSLPLEGAIAALPLLPDRLTIRSRTARPQPVVLSCGHRLHATAFAIRAGDYPLVIPVTLALPARRRLPEPVLRFFSWVEGPEAGRLMRRLGYVDMLPEPQPVSAQGDRLVSALQNAGTDVSLDDLMSLADAMDGSARLGVTARFDPGTIRPDLTSGVHIARLARDLEAGLYDGQTLLFAGFSDGLGPGAGNRRISLRRAETVLDLVRAQAALADPDRVTMKALGFGEALPLACDDSDWGQRINRRVEVWTVPDHK